MAFAILNKSWQGTRRLLFCGERRIPHANRGVYHGHYEKRTFRRSVLPEVDLAAGSLFAKRKPDHIHIRSRNDNQRFSCPRRKKRFLSRLRAMYAPYFGRIAASSAHLEQMARDNVDEERAIAQLEGLVSGDRAAALWVCISSKVGSGIGLTVAAARKVMKAEAYGIEPRRCRV